MSEKTCDDCGKKISTVEDEISYFNCDKCAECEARMFSYMNECNENQKYADVF